MSRTWRVAVLGLGHWYSAYGLARALVEYPRARLVAAAWPDREQLEAFTGTFGMKGYADAVDLLDHEDVDVVHLACPVSGMEELTLLAAARGKHIVLGKPMAMTLDGADRMVRAVESAGVVCVPFQAIMRLRLRELKARIEGGIVGDVVLLHQTSRWSIAEDWYRSGRPGWFADPRHVPGGAFIDEGIYAIDCLSWLAGSRVARVDARMANLVHKELPVEDWGMATFTFENGVIGTLEAAWTIAAPQQSGPSPKQNSVVRLEIVGTRGEIVDQSFRVPGLGILAAGASDWVFERHAGEPFVPASPSPLDHLLDCVERGVPPVATIRDARASFATALAAYRAAREDRHVLL